MRNCIVGFSHVPVDPVSGRDFTGNGYRAYNANIMLFTCPDSWCPFGPGGVNPYAYCCGDPINRADPSGHVSWQGYVGIAAGIAGLLLSPFTAGQSLVVTFTLAGTGVASSALGLASEVLADHHKTLSTALGWASLLTGLPDAAWGVVNTLRSIAGGITSVRRFLGKLQTVNGAVGIPMSGEFRNAKFLGIDQANSMVKWNFSYEDLVPSGTRLNVIMGAELHPHTVRAVNEVWWDNRWLRISYGASELINAANARSDYSMLRLIIPGASFRPERGGYSLLMNAHRLLSGRPVTGYRNIPVAQGAVAEALMHQYGLANQLRARGVVAQPEAVQAVLDELSRRYATSSNAIFFPGERPAVYPKRLLKQYPDLPEW